MNLNVHDMFDVFRIVNVALSLVVIVGLCGRMWLWAAQPVWIRLYGLGLGGIVAAATYATIEAMLRGVPGGPRVLVITVPLVWLIVAVFYPRRPKPTKGQP